MFKNFPLLYLAFLYIFSTKDKIVFFMHQFSLLVISLCISVILCSFSIMNGWNNQLTNNILNNVSPIIISGVLGNIEKKEAFLHNYNAGFQDFSINNKHITHIEKIRSQETFITVNDKRYNVSVYEDKEQKVPLSINKSLFNSLFLDTNDIKFELYDLNSYNALIGNARLKQYTSFEINNNDKDNFIIKLSESEYQKIFRNNYYNRFNVYLDDVELAGEISEQIKQINKDVDVKYWKEFDKELFDALSLQKKIFLLVYTIMFVLLCAIIVSTNIAFFKEKRKDWALLKILNTIPYSVEKVFAYKSLLNFTISTVVGVSLGIMFSIYSNEIIQFIGYLTGTPIDSRITFGTNKLTYEFQYQDFLTIISFSFFIFFINFILLISIFRKENTANFLRTQ